jgi:DnaJ-class molecular chaperone
LNFIKAFGDWNVAKQEKYISRMKEKNKCPDCRGLGIFNHSGYEFSYYSTNLDCSGCNGTGMFSTWDDLR